MRYFLFIVFLLWLLGCEENQEGSEDCAGVVGGNSVEDNCGNCDDDISNDCEQDCAGIWGGENICGCTDSTSYNYDIDATFDDGSCDTSLVVTTFIKNVEPENSCSGTIDARQTTDGLSLIHI